MCISNKNTCIIQFNYYRCKLSICIASSSVVFTFLIHPSFSLNEWSTRGKMRRWFRFLSLFLSERMWSLISSLATVLVLLLCLCDGERFSYEECPEGNVSLAYKITPFFSAAHFVAPYVLENKKYLNPSQTPFIQVCIFFDDNACGLNEVDYKGVAKRYGGGICRADVWFSLLQQKRKHSYRRNLKSTLIQGFIWSVSTKCAETFYGPNFVGLNIRYLYLWQFLLHFTKKSLNYSDRFLHTFGILAWLLPITKPGFEVYRQWTNLNFSLAISLCRFDFGGFTISFSSMEKAKITWHRQAAGRCVMILDFF